MTADWHLRASRPVCRTDEDWNQVIIDKLDFIASLKYDICLSAGDMFHRWDASWSLFSLIADHLPENVYCLPGNHDLRHSRPESISGVALGATEWLGVRIFQGSYLNIEDVTIEFLGWPNEIKNHTPRRRVRDKRILVSHEMVWVGKCPWPGAVGSTARSLQDEKYDLILTGHNHQQFHRRYGKTHIVNPGSLFRLTAIQADHEPAVFLWDSETNDVERIPIPIQPDVVDRSHIDGKLNKEHTLGSFIDRLHDVSELSLSYRDNMEEYLKRNKIRDSVKQVIWSAFDE